VARVRSWVLAVAALVLASPASATADYRELGTVYPYEQDIALAAGEVFAATTAGRRNALTAHRLDGRTRTLVPLGREGGVYFVDSSPQALVAGTARGPWFGPPSGPLALVPDDVFGGAATGSTVLTLEGAAPRAAIFARDLAAGAAPRLVARPGKDPTDLKAAGPYVSVVINHEAANSAIVVYEIATGREVYRLANTIDHGYDLGADGRIVRVGGTSGRVPIQTATPAEPRLRTIARLRVLPSIALAGDEIALARAGVISRLLLLRLDGTRRSVSGPTGPVTSIAYDGSTLAFTAGHCLYAGTGSAGPSTSSGCFDAGPRVRKPRLQGRRVIVPVRCLVPAGAHCTGRLILATFKGRVLARRRLRLDPGDGVVRVRLSQRELKVVRRAPRDLYASLSQSTSS
jgi:hypothetical protein